MRFTVNVIFQVALRSEGKKIFEVIARQGKLVNVEPWLVFVYKHNKGALNDIFPTPTDNITFLLRNRGDYATMARRLAIYSTIQLFLRLFSYGTNLTSIQGLYQRVLVLKVQ